MKIFLVIGVLLLLHTVYSTIEFHKFSKDSIHVKGLPKDILLELIIAALVALWSSAPSTEQLMKIKANEYFQDTSYNEGHSSQVFKNYYSTRSALISKRANKAIPKPPS